MKLVIIFGPHAVGKMTVGQALEKRTGLKLFHNHQAIELVLPYFSYGTPEGRALVGEVRSAMFNAFANSGAPGYILTFVWAFGEPGEREFMQTIASKFESKGADIYWIELQAPLEERLKRNSSENRLEHKPSKRDVAFSEMALIKAHETYRLVSEEGEIPGENYLLIDNANISAESAAALIADFIGANSA